MIILIILLVGLTIVIGIMSFAPYLSLAVMIGMVLGLAMLGREGGGGRVKDTGQKVDIDLTNVATFVSSSATFLLTRMAPAVLLFLLFCQIPLAMQFGVQRTNNFIIEKYENFEMPSSLETETESTDVEEYEQEVLPADILKEPFQI